jgi:hypothetical protein
MVLAACYRASGLGDPQPVQRQQRDQRVLGGLAKSGGDQQRTKLVAIQPGDMGLIIQARAADMSGLVIDVMRKITSGLIGSVPADRWAPIASVWAAITSWSSSGPGLGPAFAARVPSPPPSSARSLPGT